MSDRGRVYPNGSTTPLRTARILVVDDSHLIRRLAQLALERVPGWEVDTAESGSEACERALADAPDAILLDVVMPDMDGPATLARLRETPATAHVPVILVTARDGAEDRKAFARLGAAGVIPKPFEVPRLAGQVAEILGWAA